MNRVKRFTRDVIAPNRKLRIISYVVAAVAGGAAGLIYMVGMMWLMR